MPTDRVLVTESEEQSEGFVEIKRVGIEYPNVQIPCLEVVGRD